MEPEKQKIQPPFVGTILQEHLEELAFLRVQERYLLFSPDLPLEGLKRHRERIDAHWDGLVVGGDQAVELACKNLSEFDPWDVAVAARVWLELGQPTTDDVMEALSSAEEEMLPAWGEAFRRLPSSVLNKILPVESVFEASASVQAQLIYSRGWLRILDEVPLEPFVTHECPDLRRNLARVLGWGVTDLHTASSLIERLVEDEDPFVVRAGLWSAVLLGSTEVVDHCREKAASSEADIFQLLVLGLMGKPDDCLLVKPFLNEEETSISAVRALGYLGTPRAVSWLLDFLADSPSEELAVAAVAGLEMIVGELPSEDDYSGNDGPPMETESAENWGNVDLPDPSFLKWWWDKVKQGYDSGPCWYRGELFPRSGSEEQKSMEALWLSSLRSERPELGWLRKEIPVGFFAVDSEAEIFPGD